MTHADRDQTSRSGEHEGHDTRSQDSFGDSLPVRVLWAAMAAGVDEGGKSFCSGFLTNVGGLITLPAAIPAELYAQWVIQARLVGAIACLHGHSLDNDRVRTLIMLVLLGDASLQPAAAAMAKLGNHAARQAVKAVPGSFLRGINNLIGMRFITKAGRTGTINLTRVVPIAGGVVGGTVSCFGCVAGGRVAARAFRSISPEPADGGLDSEPIWAEPIPEKPVLESARREENFPIRRWNWPGEERFGNSATGACDHQWLRRVRRRCRGTGRRTYYHTAAGRTEPAADAVPTWWTTGFLGRTAQKVKAIRAG